MILLDTIKDLTSQARSRVSGAWAEAKRQITVADSIDESVTVAEAVKLLRRADRMNMIDGIDVEVRRGTGRYPYDELPQTGYSYTPFTTDEAIGLLAQHYNLARGHHHTNIYETGREEHTLQFLYGVMPHTRELEKGRSVEVGFSYIALPGLTLAPIHGVIKLDWNVIPYDSNKARSIN